jgi:hypothetical protein
MGNQYIVYLFLKEFNEVKGKRRFVDCELGFDNDVKRYYLSTHINAFTIEEAKKVGEKRLYKVLNFIQLLTGVSHPIIGIQAYLVSGNDIFSQVVPMMLTRTRYVPLDEPKIKEIANFITKYDNIAGNGETTKKLDQVINYYVRGCRLESTWRTESFLNFFKVIELISHNFVRNFNQQISTELKDTLLQDLTPEEVGKLQTDRRLIKYMCKELKILEEFDIKKMVRLRHEVSAHANVEEPEITMSDFNSCKCLAGQAIIKYVERK